MPDTDFSRGFASATEAADLALKVIFISTLGLNVMSSGSGGMYYMLGLINSLQIIIHLPMTKVPFPANC